MQAVPPLEVIVLAAGQGKRMASAQPKVLHPIAGTPMLHHVLEAAAALNPARIHIVVGHQAARVQSETESAYLGRTSPPRTWVLQAEQLGTGHAVMQALPGVAADAVVLIVYGDVPLVRPETLHRVVDGLGSAHVALLTAEPDDAAALGRIVRGPTGDVQRIVEFRDASDAERRIREINTGIIAASKAQLARQLGQVTTGNAQGEYYLTDVVGLTVSAGERVHAVQLADADEALGVNDREQLAVLERICQRRQAARLMQAGVSMADPGRVDIRGRVAHGRDCHIDINVILEGDVELGDNVVLGPGVIVRNARLGDGVRVEAFTVIDGAEVAADCILGPFARIRPGTHLDRGVRIGNFVETKKTRMGAGSKANHLAYLGDATVGDDCNIGAGTVTCNYDGIDKHPTTIGDRVFVGTNSTLVAPITLASDAFVAAGSTVTTRVDAGELAVGRSRQRNIAGWTRPDRRKSKDEGSH
ncbi:MAG: bifunctional UDP-N-acetylglucosamine diphosphorylase/glucosamine-1-phosphate N-acetyltransferase GlmU [Gammaproteobacteria bacterium]